LGQARSWDMPFKMLGIFVFARHQLEQAPQFIGNGG